MSLATRRDFFIATLIGFAVALFLVPILTNVNPVFWSPKIQNIAPLIFGFIALANAGLWLGGILGRRSKAIWQFTKYFAVGSLATAIDLGILNLLSFITGIFSGYLIIVLNIISFSITLANAYFLHKFWSFEKNSRPHIAEFSQYAGVTIVSVVLNSALVYFLTTTLGPPGEMSPPLWENISKVIAAVPVVIWNFTWYKLLVFKPDANS